MQLAKRRLSIKTSSERSCHLTLWVASQLYCCVESSQNRKTESDLTYPQCKNPDQGLPKWVQPLDFVTPRGHLQRSCPTEFAHKRAYNVWWFLSRAASAGMLVFLHLFFFLVIHLYLRSYSSIYNPSRENKTLQYWLAGPVFKSSNGSSTHSLENSRHLVENFIRKEHFEAWFLHLIYFSTASLSLCLECHFSKGNTCPCGKEMIEAFFFKFWKKWWSCTLHLGRRGLKVLRGGGTVMAVRVLSLRKLLFC